VAKNKKGRYFEDQEERFNRILNLAQGMADKIGVETPVDQRFKGNCLRF